MADPALGGSWGKALGGEFDQPYMRDLRQFLVEERKQGQTLYPPSDRVFAALNATELENVRVVILGQDPYHGPGQAHGLCFSVQPGVAIPPSLQNIFKEIHDDLGIAPANHGCLTSWAEQGVLLLNTVLTVRRGDAGSHRNRGWERFTDRVIEVVNTQCAAVAFLLWGSFAHKKAVLLDSRRHEVLRAPHPSPLSAHRGFFGCRHFSKANTFLHSRGRLPVDWRLPTREFAV